MIKNKDKGKKGNKHQSVEQVFNDTARLLQAQSQTFQRLFFVNGGIRDRSSFILHSLSRERKKRGTAAASCTPKHASHLLSFLVNYELRRYVFGFSHGLMKTNSAAP
jgi:hypothetical protein